MENSDKVTLILDTNDKYFTSWLKRYLNEAHECPWATDGEQLYDWHMKRQGHWDEFTSQLVFTLATRSPRAPIYQHCGEPAYYPDVEYSVLYITMSSLGDSRVEIDFGRKPFKDTECDFREELAAQIMERWPEAEGPTSPLLEKAPTVMQAYQEAFRKRKAQSLASRFSEDKGGRQAAPEEQVPATESPPITRLEMLQLVTEAMASVKAQSPAKAKGKRGPTEKIVRLAHYAKEQKEKTTRRRWSYERVAIEAMRPKKEGGLGLRQDEVNGEKVRYAVRQMGWTWQRDGPILTKSAAM